MVKLETVITLIWLSKNTGSKKTLCNLLLKLLPSPASETLASDSASKPIKYYKKKELLDASLIQVWWR